MSWSGIRAGHLTSGKSDNYSKPQSPHLQNGNSKSLLYKANARIKIKCYIYIASSRVHSEIPVKVSNIAAFTIKAGRKSQ